MDRPLTHAQQLRVRLRSVRERLARARALRPAWPKLAEFEADLHRTIALLPRLGWRAANLHVALLETTVDVEVGELDRRIALEELLPVAQSRLGAGLARVHAARIAELVATAERTLRSDDAAAIAQLHLELARRLDDADLLERVRVQRAALAQRLERCRAALPRHHAHGALAHAARLVHDLARCGADWEPAVSLAVLRRIEDDLHFMEERAARVP